jgi:hypothetical protein
LNSSGRYEASLCALSSRLNPSHQDQNNNDDQNDAERAPG